jgi:acyl-CoA synthetase (AMP-forming)/AMP-acid ligase II
MRDAPETAAGRRGRWVWGTTGAVGLTTEEAVTCLHPHAPSLADRSVVIATRDQLLAACALLELAGCVRRVMLCPPEVTADQRAPLAARAGADTLVTDSEGASGGGLLHVRCSDTFRPLPRRQPQVATEWVLLTSGTAGPAKMVRHTWSTLTGAIAFGTSGITWGTFYDIRRYGGLQVLLRALTGGGSLVVGSRDEAFGDYLERLAAHGATHVTGTPSHWRRVLMSANADAIAPRYIRLSGEIADQGILDALRARYPAARIVHAFASTEAGVGFEVDDGLAGFPATVVDAAGDVSVRVDDGSLRLRSRRTALGYLDPADGPLADADGFVDTGDAVERRGDRYYFLGRRSGVINIGGLKVHPEEIEAAINLHPGVRMSKVRSKRSPIIGSLVAADVVLDDAADAAASTREILSMCRDLLPAHKVPAVVRIVPALDLASTGKLARHGA